jgi:hypothetical protein
MIKGKTRSSGKKAITGNSGTVGVGVGCCESASDSLLEMLTV